jgi:mannose-6-phosphate isomerase-like protein (cupin superfamily)
MGKIIVRHADSVHPTIFKGRESRRLISPERDSSERMSLHKIHRFGRGISYEVNYPKNDEILYILEGEGYIFEGEKRIPFKPGSCVFVPANNTYQIYNTGDLHMLAVLSPPRYRDEWKDRPDIVRLEPEEQPSKES